VEPYEETTHSFIIRLWRESPDGVRGGAWRGHITHVPSGRRQYVQTLGQVSDFIADYLERMDVRVGRWERLMRLVRRTRR
jgi:hypothetical protein